MALYGLTRLQLRAEVWLTIIAIPIALVIGAATLGYEHFDLRHRPEKAACRAGSVDTCLRLGHLYQDDDGLLGSKSAARTYYAQACTLGSPVGCYRSAWLSAWGGDALFDVKEQVRGFTAGCEGQIPEACDELGRVYVTGSGVPADEVRAAGLFQRGCDGQVMKSCFWLGLFRSQARGGLTADPAAAKELFAQACDGGVDDACLELK